MYIRFERLKFTINIYYTFTSDCARISSTVFINTYSCSTWKTFGSVSVTARPRCVWIVTFRFCRKCQNESSKILNITRDYKKITNKLIGKLLKINILYTHVWHSLLRRLHIQQHHFSHRLLGKCIDQRLEVESQWL